MEMIRLNPDFSTTRQLIKGGQSGNFKIIAKGPEGGLRKAGYTKSSTEADPLVSIITVIFNGASLLEKTIQSVLELEYSNVEYIIIDGGSTDGTLDILRKYNDRIDYWVSEPDEGIYDAMNKGWLLANDDAFILFLGAGDTIISLPDNMAQFKKTDIIYGKVKEGEGWTFISRADWKLRISNTLHHQALIINKSINPQPPFDISFKKFADFDFNQRLYKEGHNFVKSESFLSAAAPAGVSGKPDISEAASIIRKNFGAFWSFVYRFNYFRKKTERFFVNLFSKTG